MSDNGYTDRQSQSQMPLFDLIETSMSVANRERNLAIQETLRKWFGKLKNISGASFGLVSKLKRGV